MDIEVENGNRYSQPPKSCWRRFLRSSMEMHGFDDPKIVEVPRKLKRNFYLVNLHFNNWSCTPKARRYQHGRIRPTG